jgi:hypothetical protein
VDTPETRFSDRTDHAAMDLGLVEWVRVRGSVRSEGEEEKVSESELVGGS